MGHDEKDFEKELINRAEKLAQIVPATPEFAYFKALVDRQQAKTRRAQRVQLALFIAVAMALVPAVILLSGQFQMFFLVLQGAAFTGAILGLAVFVRKARQQGEGAH